MTRSLGSCMMVFGIFGLGRAAWVFDQNTVPEAFTMGSIGLLALIANVAVAAMLYAYREGDANMRSVWLCSRNDAIGNIAVMLAALGVLGTASAWPDLLVACGMAVLALIGGWSVIGQAIAEIKHDKAGIGCFHEQLRQKVAQGVSNAKALYRDLRSQGYAGGYSPVRRAVHRLAGSS